MCQTSSPGSPSTIQSAMIRPMPPAPAMPWAQKPHATKNPRTSGASPRMNSPSGVKASGPLMRRTISALPIAGTRCTAPSMIGAKRSQSGGRRRWLKSAGMPSSPHGAGSRSYPPATSPDLLAEVHEVVRVAEHRNGRVHTLDRLGDEVLVRHRHQRDRDARHPPDLRRIHPARVHHDVGADAPGRRLHFPHPAVPHGDAQDARAGSNAHTAAPRPLGQRHGEPARVEVPVRREVDRPQDAVQRHHREQAPRLGRPDLVERKPEGLGPSLLTSVLEDAIGRAREPEASRLLPARIPAGLGGEAPIALDAPHHQPGQGDRGPELPHEAGGVEGGAARQLRPLEEQDVAPSLRGEMVGNAGAAHSATDDDRTSVLGHGARL